MGTIGGITIRRPGYARYTEILTLEKEPDILLPVKDNTAITVGEGDAVLVGQLVAVPLGKETPVHASVSGRVMGTLRRDGREYIRIRNDGKNTPSPEIAPCVKRLSAMTREEMIDRIRLCGLDIHKELTKLAGKAERMIVSCIDEDPAASDRRCETALHAKQAIQGAKILLKILGLRCCEIAVIKSETDIINDLVDAIGDSELFDLMEVGAKYPHCELSRLPNIPDANGECPDPELCFLTDIHILSAVYRAFSEGMPYVRRLISVGGDADVEMGCYDLPLGTPLDALIPKDCADEEPPRVIPGGGMIGDTNRGNICVDGSFSSVLYAVPSHLTKTRYGCIGCQKCDGVCPEDILPSVFVRNYQKNPVDAYNKSGMAYCTECGACTYICPAGIPIGDMIAGKPVDVGTRSVGKKETITSAPFLRTAESVRGMRFDLLLPLLILCAWSGVMFGARALLLCLIGAASAVLCEVLFDLAVGMSPRTVLDLSGACCGILCALTLPASAPLYLPALTAFIASVFVRGASGGDGKALFHAAFLSRVAAEIFFHGFFTGDTHSSSIAELLIGKNASVMGEGAILLLCGIAAYLLIRRTISFWIPMCMIPAYAIVSFLLLPAGSDVASAMQTAILGSALLFAAVFCGAEYSTVPGPRVGRAVYGIVAGGIGALISRFTSFEGIYIGILLASLLTPLFNRFYNVDVNDDEEDESNAEAAPIIKAVPAPIIKSTPIRDVKKPEETIPEPAAQKEGSNNTVYFDAPKASLSAEEKEDLLDAFASANSEAEEDARDEAADEMDIRQEVEDRMAMLMREIRKDEPKPSVPESTDDASATALFEKLYEEADISAAPSDDEADAVQKLIDKLTK